MTKTWPEWTKQEQAMLCKNYADFDGEALDDLFLRHSLDDINAQASKLGLQYDQREWFWSEEEKQILRQNSHLPTRKLKKMLPGRTEYAIYKKAWAMGITVSREQVPSVEWSDQDQKRGHKTQPVRVRFDSEEDHARANSLTPAQRGTLLAAAGELGADVALEVLRAALAKRSA